MTRNTEEVVPENPPVQGRRRGVVAVALALVVGVLLGAALGFALGERQASRASAPDPGFAVRAIQGSGIGLVSLGIGGQTPGPNSADVGFARDMSVHHAQAVEMSKLLYDRTADEEMRILAYDIMLTQQAQIGMMSGWLDSWGQARNSSGPRMAWMGMPVEGLMPGMATREQLSRLESAEDLEADAIFMQLMIPHHQSGVLMAESALAQAQSEPVRNLARAMAESQIIEIEYMQRLLQEKGYEPVPEMEMDMHMDMDMSR